MYEKYAELLLIKCLNMKPNQPLIIKGSIEVFDFIKVLRDKAKSLGINDIYLDIENNDYKRLLLNTLSIEEIEEHPMFNKSIYDEYAKTGCATIILDSTEKNNLYNIESIKILKAIDIKSNTGILYNEMKNSGKIPWVIAPVATTAFANLVYPYKKDNVTELWNAIFKVNGLFEDTFDDLLKEREERCIRLNELNFNTLYYKNKLGTNLSVKLDRTSVWKCYETDMFGNKFIPNIPSFEIYTSPIRLSANGIVYASKPLVVSEQIMDNIMFNFKDGKIDSFCAKRGLDKLKRLLEYDNGLSYIGEIALVDSDSLIAQSGIDFKNILLDENAACHIGLGDGFRSCMNNKTNLNTSRFHLDIMMGTDDLEITGETYDKQKYKIYEDGKYDLRKVK